MSAQPQPIETVHVEDANRCATDVTPAMNLEAMHSKVLRPCELSRIEEGSDRVRLWVDTGEVRSFMEIAVVARQRQIAEFVGTTMLFRNDVLDVKAGQCW